MLELRNCIFAQGGFRLHADWSLETAARLAVIGPSGAGKSTLLAGIAGFAQRTAGQVLLNGSELPDRPDARPVAMLFQDHNLFPHLTVGQNVGLGLAPTLRLAPDQSEQAASALRDVGLDGFRDRRPGQLSGGQQSRAALARVLVMARPLVLLDEPFSALGPGQRADMLRLVRTVSDRLGATLVMVTHDPDEALALGGLVSFVESGRAAPPVAAQTFFRDPPEAMRRYRGD